MGLATDASIRGSGSCGIAAPVLCTELKLQVLHIFALHHTGRSDAQKHQPNEGKQFLSNRVFQEVNEAEAQLS